MIKEEKNIDVEISQNFIDFSHEANCQRAFADARDGLKPGQRAALWEMFVKGYTSNKPHVKAAKISGGTIATWWPHSSTAVYETFARMSQSWINNIPEVDWHGANGSIQISGEPAADRYCEARLSKSTEEGLLLGIKKHNVPMKLNFSEDEEWPEVFPAIFPRLMVNGCQGIGSTIANNWLPHSLDELAKVIREYIAGAEIDYKSIAPSFPTGGIIINKNDLSSIYTTGKGQVVLRAKTEIKNDTIFITEMPYQVYVEPFIEQVKELVVKDEIVGISNIYNKSSKKQLLIEIECDGSPRKILNQLFAKTDLQKTYSANHYALVGKTPKLLSLKEYLDIYLNHNYDCIKREYSFNLDRSKKRLEIVLGLVKALEDIDAIISLIKTSSSSKTAIESLENKYKFTENQAKAIVEMRLGQLAHLEKIELNHEKEELISTIQNCEEVISNVSRQQQIYLERFNSFVDKYGDARRTTLLQLNEKESVEAEEAETCIVTLSQNGNLKRLEPATFRTQKRNGKGNKNLNDTVISVIKTDTASQLAIFSSTGLMYRLPVENIPNITKGINIKQLIPLESKEKATLIYSIRDGAYIFFVTKNGLVKKTALEEYAQCRKKNGIIAINLKEDDEIVSTLAIEEEGEVLLITKRGNVIRFNTSEVAPTGRATAGVKGITLEEGDEVIAALAIRDKEDDIGLFLSNGYGKRVGAEEITLHKRGGKGISCNKTKVHSIVAAVMMNNKDTLLVCGNPTSICISASEVVKGSRLAAGVPIIKESNIIAVSKI